MNHALNLTTGAPVSPPTGSPEWLLERHPPLAQLIHHTVGDTPWWPQALNTLINTYDDHIAHLRHQDALATTQRAWLTPLPDALIPLTSLTSTEHRLLRTLATLIGPVLWQADDLWALDPCPHPNCPGLTPDVITALTGRA